MTNRIIDVAHGHHLTMIGTVDQGSYGTAPYVAFNGSTDYARSQAGVVKGINGLTCGGWFQMTSGDTLMSVWQESTNKVWKLYTFSTAPAFSVSDDGSAEDGVFSSATITAGAWTFIAARYTPSTEIAIWKGVTKTVNTTSIPASLYDSATAEFVVGGIHGGSDLLTGKASMVWLTHEPLTDMQIRTIYEMSRNLYGV